MTNDARSSQEETSLERRAFLKSATAATGLTLTGPILGVTGALVSVAEDAIAQAVGGAITPFAYRYGGTFIAGLNRVFGYNSLYDASGNLKTGINRKSDGTIDRATSTTLGIFLAKYPTPKSYTEKEFGKLAAELLDDSDWFDINGQPIKSIYPGDAANIFQEHRKNFAQIFDANFRLPKPLPVFLFVGSSGLKKDYDPAKQSGYRFITTTAKIADNPSDSLIMGILCPTDA